MCCRDFVDAFANHFDYLFGAVITEITVGLGPAGELRYPSYPEGDGRCECDMVYSSLLVVYASSACSYGLMDGRSVLERLL
jgi:hypothetical protein